MLGIGCPNRHPLPLIAPPNCAQAVTRAPPARAGSFVAPFRTLLVQGETDKGSRGWSHKPKRSQCSVYEGGEFRLLARPGLVERLLQLASRSGYGYSHRLRGSLKAVTAGYRYRHLRL